MAAIFQIRRGDGPTPLVDGELYVNKGPDSLQYAVGTREITLAKLDELNTGSLYLSGDITASNMFISGNLHISGNLILGNSGSDTITATGEFTSNLIPNPTDTYNLGSDTKRWGRMFANSVSASAFTGSLFGMGDPTSFSTSVDLRLDRVEASASLYDNAMSGSNRLYVSPSGSDSNDGQDPSTPFRTIKAAVESLYPIEPSNPLSSRRYTIFVGSGNYTEQNPIVVPPGVAIVGDTLRTVRLTAANPTKDFFHTHDSNYFYGLRFLDLKYPAFAFSFPSSTATGSISAGGISSIGVVHSMTGYTDGNNQNLGIVIEGPDASGSIATATANVVGGVITQINVVNAGTNYVNGEKPHISIPAPAGQRPVITTSPYVQNCSSITGPFNTSGVKVLQTLPYSEAAFNIDEQGAGGGIRIDGNLVDTTSPLESFVADAFTQVNQGGPGHLVINKGYAQFVSCFTTFCTYGFKTANGGFANISNSVIDFGKYGLVSKTYFPQTYNTGSSLETKTSQVSGVIFTDKGAGYTGSTVPVRFEGGGYTTQATGYATINNDTSLADIVITNSGSGYTARPIVDIDAPTAIGNRPAVILEGKALISGVSEMLMALESGSRGIDISSNMVLNGVDYLVTDVAAVSGYPNRRRVTTYPAPPSITTENNVYFHQLSNISTGGLVMEYAGSGVTYNALPKFGGVPIRTREINEFAPGRVFYSTVDNIGNLKIGDFFAVNQLTGEVTIDANSFNLSGLNAIGPFKRNGAAVGVVLQEVSNNTTLLNSQGLFGEDTVPTQYAVKGYIDIRDGRLNNLETTSASVNTSVASLNTYTASLKTAIDVTGGNTRIIGNLIVDGTQTSLNTTETFIEDKSITLASGSTTSGIADGAGLNIAGANVSMSWEDSNQRLYFNTNIAALGSISSSTIVGLNGASVTTYSTSVDSRIVSLSNTSTTSTTRLSRIEESTASLNLFSASVTASLVSINNTTASLNSFTESTNIRLGLLETSTGSLNTFSGSTLTRLGLLETSTGSLNTFSGSTLTRLGLLETSTGSLNLFTASAYVSFSLMTASIDDHEDRIVYVEGTLGIVGGNPLTSLNTFSASAKISIQNLEAATGSYETKGRSIVSGSSQITYASISSIPGGIVSGSSQIVPLLPTGVVSGSSQISLTATTGYGTYINQAILTTSSPTFAGLTINGAITATGNISAYVSSDRRLKNNIVPIENALTKLNKIGGYSFDWTDDYIEKESNGKGEDGYFFRKHDIGVIAQELQEILPEAVAEKTDGYLGVRYEKIIPLLIQSIKELQLEIKELKNSK